MRWLWAWTFLLAACGGGPGSSSATDEPVVPPPPVCCADLSALAETFEDASQYWLDAYEDSAQYDDGYWNSLSKFGHLGHLQSRRDLILHITQQWSEDAAAEVDAVADEGIDVDGVQGLFNDYRASFLSYMLASYDHLTSQSSAQDSYKAQTRAEIESGINAIFDDLDLWLTNTYGSGP